MRAHKVGTLVWTDLITRTGTKRVSLSKLLQLIGGITVTWVVIYMTTASTISADILLCYLAYVGGIEGWSKYLIARYGGESHSRSQEGSE